MNKLLEWRDLSKSYSDQSLALNTQSFSINTNDKLAIVGATGSGKSTLLRLLAGLEQPTSGEIWFNGEKVAGPQDKLIPGHPEIAYLSQHFELPKFITVFQHLDDPYLIAPSEAEKIYKACQITHLLDKDTRALSGGEKQRVALAKLLLRSPKLLLLDEPFSNLDFNHKRIIKKVVKDVEQELGTTVILVAHDPMDVLSWAERILVFKNGDLIQEADPKTIYNYPADTYVAGLFGPYNLIDPSNSILKFPDHIKSIDNQVFIRPEFLEVSSRKNGLEGKIVEVLYQGHHDELRIQTQKDVIVAFVPVGTYMTGDQVFIDLILELNH